MKKGFFADSFDFVVAHFLCCKYLFTSGLVFTYFEANVWVRKNVIFEIKSEQKHFLAKQTLLRFGRQNENNLYFLEFSFSNLGIRHLCL